MNTPLQFVMPFAEKDEIETARVASILGVSMKEVLSMLQAGHLEYRRNRPRGNFYIAYSSLVRYCGRFEEPSWRWAHFRLRQVRGYYRAGRVGCVCDGGHWWM